VVCSFSGRGNAAASSSLLLLLLMMMLVIIPPPNLLFCLVCRNGMINDAGSADKVR
jgi:hypothetical protein